MKLLKSVLGVFIFSFVGSLQGAAQPLWHKDSLISVLNMSHDNIEKVKIYYRLAWIYASSNSESGLVNKYADSIRMLSQKLNYEKGIAWSHFFYGVSHRHQGNYPEAVEHLNKYIGYNSGSGDSVEVANGLFHLGAIHGHLGNNDKSLSLSLRALKIYEFEKRPYGIASALHSIGLQYLGTQEYDKAIDCFTKSLNLEDSLAGGKTTQASALTLSSLGDAHMGKEDWGKAGKYFELSMNANRELGNSWGMALALEDLGSLFNQIEKYEEALSYYYRSLTIKRTTTAKKRTGLVLKVCRLHLLHATKL